MKSKVFSQVLLLAALLGAVVLIGSPLAAAAGEGHALSLTVIGHGAIRATPNLTSYAPGQQVSLAAVPDPGWQFIEWRGEFDLPPNWHDSHWRYRLALAVDSGNFARLDQPASVSIDFARELTLLGASGEFDPNSLRLVEVNASGSYVTDQVPFQFDAALDQNSGADATGTLVFLLDGETAAHSTRYFHVYFETKEAAIVPLQVPAQLMITADVMDEGQLSYRIDTAVASYFLQKQGAALSSLVDKANNDWIGYQETGGSAGNYRGIPNVQPDYFHPGATSGASTLVASGPLRAVVRTETSNGWAMEWQFYPRFATVTVLKMATPYWFLYEGTPGGSLDLASDFVVRSDGAQNMANESWTNDLPDPEWLYFGDPQINRSLFLAHGVDDGQIDSYWQMEGNMGVFGYGRDGLARYLTEVPNTFTLGLIDTTSFTPAAQAINGMYQPLPVTLLAPEQRSTAAVAVSNPLQMEVHHDMTITAFFAQVGYALGVSTVGQGSVAITPLQPTYAYGEVVHLSAVPAPGWSFGSWSGGVTGAGAEIDVTITGNTRVTATFTPPQETSLQIDIVGRGEIVRSPEGTLHFGDEVSLAARPAPCWEFAGWSGSMSGDENPAILLMNGDKKVRVTFVETGCPVYLPMVSS